jgi:DNA-binding IscR family transcriptional regulator
MNQVGVVLTGTSRSDSRTVGILILLELKNARIVGSLGGAKGGYQLGHSPSEIRLSGVIRLIDGPLSPFGDAHQLRVLISRDTEHRALYQVFLDVRDETAGILENATFGIHRQRPQGFTFQSPETESRQESTTEKKRMFTHPRFRMTAMEGS